MSSHDRDTRRIHAQYTAAVLELARAMNPFNAAAVPLDPDPGGQVPPWTADHVTVMRRCAAAWTAVVDRRRALDAATREAERPVP